MLRSKSDLNAALQARQDGLRYLLTTVPHTGTNFFYRRLLEQVGDFREIHCWETRALSHAREADVLMTTWRDPYRTLASWWNRGLDNRQSWFDAWGGYQKVLQMDPIIFCLEGPHTQHGVYFGNTPLNAHEDTLGLHAALDRQDLETFHSIVPEDWLDACCPKPNRVPRRRSKSVATSH